MVTAAILLAAAWPASAADPAAQGAAAAGFNRPGDLLIADQFNNRVIEVNAQY